MPKAPTTTKSVKIKKVGPQATVLGTQGQALGKVTLPVELFATKINKKLLAQAVRVYLANRRSGTAATKTRGEVRGSTRKLYRQKGTGRARHGAIRAPIFVGGGIVFGPQPRDYSLKLTKKMKRVALASALTSKYQDGKVVIVAGLETLAPKTKFLVKALEAVSASPRTLLVVGPETSTVVRAARNIAEVDILPAENLNPYAVLSHQKLIFTKQSLPVVAEVFGQARPKSKVR